VQFIVHFWPLNFLGPPAGPRGRDSPWIWAGLIFFCVWGSTQGLLFAQTTSDRDPNTYVVKEYPDGTRFKVRWKDVRTRPEEAEAYGGPPIVRELQGNERQTLGEEPSDPPPVQESVPAWQEAMDRARPKPEPVVPSAPVLREETREVRSRGKGGNGFAPMGPSVEYGQSFQDYGPQTLRFARPPPAAEVAPRPVELDPEEAKVRITDHLRGVVLWGSPAQVQPKGVRGVTGVDSHVEILGEKDVQPLLAPFFGQPATFATVEEIRQKLTRKLVEKGRLLTAVILPAQEVAEGTLQFLVLEGRLGKVTFEGNRYFSSEKMGEKLRLRPGEPLAMGTLLDDVAELNGNPFRQAQAALEPGAAAGETDVVFTVQDRFPVRPFISYDNFGVQTLGYDRYSAGASVMDVWSGLDQQFNFQYLTSGGFSELRSYSGSYVAALPWHHNLTVFGSYSAANPNASGLLSQSDFFWQTSFRYNFVLPILSLLDTGDFRHQAYVGYDFKSADSNVFFSGAPLTPTLNGLVGTYNISQFVFGYTLSLADEAGSTSFEAAGFGSPGGMTADNSDGSFQQIDGGATANYLYGKFSLSRLVTLPLGMKLTASFQTQQADANLMPSESYGIGGYDTVRGYDQRSANGDNGYLANVEWRLPPVSFARLAGAETELDQLVFLGFFDWGKVTQYSADTVTSVNTTLMSVGPGLRYQVGPYASVRFDWGFQLKTAPAGTTGGPGGRPGTSQAVLSATLAY